jgi:hypothetical protein
VVHASDVLACGLGYVLGVDWLSDDRLRASFTARAALLDEAVARAQRALALEAVQVIDRSNRTGAGKGTVEFDYCVLLEDRQDDGPVSVARVTLTCFEPLTSDVGAVVKATWLAEQFWPSSSSSLLRLKGGIEWAWDKLPSVQDLADHLASMMSEARRALGRTDAA